MKKTILLTITIGLSTLAMAQTKPEPKPQWQFKPQTPVSFSVTLQVGLLDTYVYVGSNGGLQAVETSDKLTGKQITSVKQAYQAATDSIGVSLYRAYQKYLKEDQAKFTADTLKLYHPKTK